MNADSAAMYNSAQSKGMAGLKKQLQPSQAKNSMRSAKESYRRAGYSSIQVSQSPNRDERAVTNFSTRQPVPPTTNLFSFNDIKEEVKETESQIDQTGNQPTFNIGTDLLQPNENF